MPSYPTRLLCIGTKRGANLGIVYDDTGRALGKVHRESKVAAGLKGQRRTFYTATVHMPNGERVTWSSLGTRHPNRWSAARAIRKFHDAYPLVGKGVLDAYEVARLVALFKYDYWQDCALSVRNLPNPRAVAR